MEYHVTEEELAELLFLTDTSCLPGAEVTPREDEAAAASLADKGYIVPCPTGYRLGRKVSELLQDWKDTLFIMNRAGPQVQIGILVGPERILCYRKRNDIYDIVTRDGLEELDEQICRLNGLPQLPNVEDSFALRMTVEEGAKLLGMHTEEDLVCLQRKYGIPTTWFKNWWNTMMPGQGHRKTLATIYDVKERRTIHIVFVTTSDAIYMCVNARGTAPYIGISKGGTEQIVPLLYTV